MQHPLFDYARHPLEKVGKQIRLLRLGLGDWNDPLECRMLTVSLAQEVPDYHALSYVWGDKGHLDTIFIRGLSLRITRNLFEALRRIRAHHQDTILLWVDAICIDQNSTCERNHQVGLMGSIYSSAKQVLVWMGELNAAMSTDGNAIEGRCYRFQGDRRDFAECAEDYDTAFDIDREQTSSILSVRAQAIPSMSLHLAWMFRILADQRHLIEIPPFCLDESASSKAYFKLFFEGIEFLVDNAWFERLWVVQEVVLAKDVRVLFGCVSIPWSVLVAGMHNFWKHTPARCCLSSGPLHYELRITIRGLLQQFASLDMLAKRCAQGLDLGLFDLSLELLSRRTTEDVDRVFALLGMQGQGRSEHRIVPHYEMKAEAVYLDVVRKHIAIYNNLYPLAFAGPRNRCAELPSWAVDFTAFETSSNQSMETWLCVGPLFKLWSSSFVGATSAYVVLDELHADMIELGMVETVGQVMDTDSFFECIQDWREIVLAKRQPKQEYDADQSWADAWLRTLCADSCWGSNSARRINCRDLELLLAEAPALRLDHDYTRPIATSCGGSSAFNSRDGELQSTSRRTRTSCNEDALMFTLENGQQVPLKAHCNDILRMVHAMTYGRRMLVTTSGLLGIGNKDTQRGDVVAAIHKAPTPLILRRQRPETSVKICESYTLLGCAYVHAIMDSSFEALRATGLGKLQRVRIL